MLRIRRFVKGDEETYLRVHNEGFSTEEWWGILQKAVTLEEVSQMDYDAIGEVAAMVGHDLRNPLTAIATAAYYLKMKLDPRKDKKTKESPLFVLRFFFQCYY